MMKINLSLILLTLAMACAHRSSKEEKAAFANKLQKEKLQTVKDLAPSPNSRLPLKAGQWVKLLTTVKESNEQGLITYKVLKVNGNNITMEVVNTSAALLDLNVTQYEIENFPVSVKLDISKAELERLLDKMEVKKITVRNGHEEPHELPKTLMPMTKNTLKQAFASGYRVGEPKAQACSSAYLSSKKCIVFDYEASAFGFSTKGQSFAHGAVPIVGIIKSESDKSNVEVVNFDLTGAQSSL